MSERLEKSSNKVVSMMGVKDYPVPRKADEPLPEYKKRIEGLLRVGEESIEKAKESVDQRKQELGKAELLIGHLETALKERGDDPGVLRVLAMMRANKEEIEKEVEVLEVEMARLREAKERCERLLRILGVGDAGEKKQMEA